MAEATKEKDSNALITQEPAEIMPRTYDMERWWPTETGMMM